MKKLELIHPRNVNLVWPHIEGILEKAISKIAFFEWTLDDIKEILQDNKAQLWMVGAADFIGITRIIKTSRKKHLSIDLIAGTNHLEYLKYLKEVELWATNLGASYATAEIRPGLKPTVNKIGWQEKRIKVFKDLSNRIH